MVDRQSLISSVEPFRLISDDETIKEALEILNGQPSNFINFCDPWNVQKITLVHLAAYRGELEILGRVSPKDLVAIDKLGRCALHYAACQGNVEVVEWLLEQRESEAEAGYGETLSIILNHDAVITLSEENPSRFDVHDKLGRTPLHVAAYEGHTDCVRILISKGLCLGQKDKRGKTVVDAIFENVRQPVAFLTEILDEQVTWPEFGDVVTMKFQMLAALPTTSSSDAKGFDEISNLQVLLALITPLSIIEPTAIIQHPLVAHFLQTIRPPRDAWQFMNSLLNLVYISSLCWIMYCETSIDGKCFPLSVACPLLFPLSVVILASRAISFYFILRKFKNFIDVWNFRYFLIGILIVNTSANILTIILSCTPRGLFCTNSNCWNLWLEIFLTMLVPWVFIMQILTYFPSLGQHIFMFYTVLYTVIKVLATFSAVIFSFAYSFSILFSGTDQFSSFWKSCVTTSVMMTGEYDYNSLFRNETNSTSVENNDDGLVLRSIILLIFVIVINIVLMNLMIGLAVNDINKLSEESRSRWLKLRAIILLHTLTRRYLKRRIYAIFACCINEPTSKLCSCLEGELKLRWDEIPEDIKEGIREVALRKSSNRDKESDKEITQKTLTAVQSSLAAVKLLQAAMQSSSKRMVVEQELQN